MSKSINTPEKRKEILKHLLLRLHEGDNPEILRKQLIEALRNIPYHEVVEVEQELINANALTTDEILEFCDLHTAVLDGSIDFEESQPVPAGHPVDTFIKENDAIGEIIEQYYDLKRQLSSPSAYLDVEKTVLELRNIFNSLSDIDKHYLRKEYLVFPYLEKKGITGPPTVMWGKHDETRALLKNSHEALSSPIASVDELKAMTELVLEPAIEQIDGMIMKEEEILLPMAMDALSEEEWYKVYKETTEFGYCLYDPKVEWHPEGVANNKGHEYVQSDSIKLSSGAFNIDELEALFIHLPIDITFVDKNDKVRFFSHSQNRVFERNRSIIGRDVRMCHPPASVHIVEQILEDFKSGKENKSVFWMSNFKGRFIYIEYTAVRSPEGEYLGVVEVTQDITRMRELEGDQRLLSYEKK